MRIELAGGLYHVMSRGNERRAIVRDAADCQRRLDWLQRTVETYGWRLHAFVLMTAYEESSAAGESKPLASFQSKSVTSQRR